MSDVSQGGMNRLKRPCEEVEQSALIIFHTFWGSFFFLYVRVALMAGAYALKAGLGGTELQPVRSIPELNYTSQP